MTSCEASPAGSWPCYPVTPAAQLTVLPLVHPQPGVDADQTSLRHILILFHSLSRKQSWVWSCRCRPFVLQFLLLVQLLVLVHLAVSSSDDQHRGVASGAASCPFCTSFWNLKLRTKLIHARKRALPARPSNIASTSPPLLRGPNLRSEMGSEVCGYLL